MGEDDANLAPEWITKALTFSPYLFRSNSCIYDVDEGVGL